jgi:hypothetical protein
MSLDSRQQRMIFHPFHSCPLNSTSLRAVPSLSVWRLGMAKLMGAPRAFLYARGLAHKALYHIKIQGCGSSPHLRIMGECATWSCETESLYAKMTLTFTVDITPLTSSSHFQSWLLQLSWEWRARQKLKGGLQLVKFTTLKKRTRAKCFDRFEEWMHWLNY